MFVGVHNGPVRLVVIAASAGGFDALSKVLGVLPPDFPAPVVVVLHRRPGPGDLGVPVVARTSTLDVRAAASGDPLRRPGVRLVPGRATATVTAAGRLRVVEGGDRNPGDALFTSAAARFGRGVCAVVLTGRLDDGTRGIRAVKRAGGRVVVEQPGTARFPGMPTSAVATGCADLVLPLHVVGPALVALTMAPGGAALFATRLPAWAGFD